MLLPVFCLRMVLYEKNRKLWIVSAALVAVVLVAALPAAALAAGGTWVPKSAPSSGKRSPRTAGSARAGAGHRTHVPARNYERVGFGGDGLPAGAVPASR